MTGEIGNSRHQEPPAEDERTRRFIISRPVVAPLSLVGRGTRGYWAADTTTRSVVFIKDSWRSCWSESLEAETQQHLSEIGVRFVPPVVWYGDVANPGTSGKLSPVIDAIYSVRLCRRRKVPGHVDSRVDIRSLGMSCSRPSSRCWKEKTPSPGIGCCRLQLESSSGH